MKPAEIDNIARILDYTRRGPNFFRRIFPGRQMKSFFSSNKRSIHYITDPVKIILSPLLKRKINLSLELILLKVKV